MFLLITLLIAVGLAVGILLGHVAARWGVKQGMSPSLDNSIDQKAFTLVQDHYEQLAFVSGTLGWLLRNYLDSRYNHLLLVYPDATGLRSRLATIAKEAANDSFFYFCSLLHHFDAFQRQSSGTYLLPNHEAGETLRRLCNTFLANVPQGTSSDAIDSYRILAISETSELSLYDFQTKVQGPTLNKDFQAFENWLLEGSYQVTIAAGALVEYHELLTRQLTYVYKSWSGRFDAETGRRAAPVPRDEFLAQLGEAALEHAMCESDLPRPLGRVRSSVEPLSPSSRAQAAPVTSSGAKRAAHASRPSTAGATYNVFMQAGSTFVGLDQSVQAHHVEELVGRKEVRGDQVRRDKVLGRSIENESVGRP